MSPTTAAVVLIVVIALVGGAGYAGLNSIGGQGKSTRSTCTPPTAAQCVNGPGTSDDVILFVAYQPGVGQDMVTFQQGQSLPATVSLSGGEQAKSFSVNWGDGTISNQTSPSFNHVYGQLGTFVLSASAVVGNTVHTGPRYLYPVEVVPTVADSASGDFPILATSFSNGSSTGPNYPWITVGGQVKVASTYSSLPTAPGFTALPPSILRPAGATQVAYANSTDSASATYSFSTAGSYRITMVGPVRAPGGAVDYQNYTWSVFVGTPGQALGCTDCRASGSSSPHTGQIWAYEIAPGGATSLDPAVDYETVGNEIIQNVYETLVTYNQSSTATYAPDLSTCVPGPAATGPTSCQSQFGTDLVDGNYWTFPLDANARFYDPSTGASWGVYPSDVMFSVARTLMWLESPSQYITNGWIIGQSLLPFGEKTWDGGLHVPWNNTPQTVLSSMLVNDTAYCPESAIANGHGCITFDVDGSGATWPEFLEFVADPAGASVVPCGWFSSVGAGLPGFTTHAPNGDGSCTLPGGATTTNGSAFQGYVAAASPTLYDPIIALDVSSLYAPQPSVRWNVAGSGPYYLESVNQGQGYILKQNPAYAQPNCAGQPYCFPPASDYPKTVYVFWDPNSVTGVEQYIAGESDFSVTEPTDIPTILNLVREGKIRLSSLATLNEFPEGFAYHFDPSAAQSASGITTNIPGDFFSYIGMREFFAQTFPYYSDIVVDQTTDGVPSAQGIGGVIPQYLGNYYPENISWPGLNTSKGLWPQVWQDPDLNPADTGSAGWWWAQLINPSSPWYDPEAVACTHSSCSFPLGSELGATFFDAVVDQWIEEIEKASGNALQPTRWDPTFTEITVNLGAQPGTSGFDTFVSGWLPDYPDPTDYMVPFYLPDGSYTFAGALNETLVGGEFGTSYNGCSAHAADTFADLVYWANVTPLVPQNCQGTAYSVMTWAVGVAGALPVGPQRILYYNLVEHVANALTLYVYTYQQIVPVSYASWINPSTIDLNPVSPGQFWFNWNGNGVVS